MTLRLKIGGPLGSRLGERGEMEFGSSGGTIGRSPECDWALPDAHRYLSSRHASIDFRGGCYYIVDTSTNGVYVNDAEHPVGRGKPQRLFNGDRIRMGEYVIAVAIDDDTIERLIEHDHADPIPLGQRVEAPSEPTSEMVDAYEITGVGIEMMLTDDELASLSPPPRKREGYLEIVDEAADPTKTRPYIDRRSQPRPASAAGPTQPRAGTPARAPDGAQVRARAGTPARASAAPASNGSRAQPNAGRAPNGNALPARMPAAKMPEGPPRPTPTGSPPAGKVTAAAASAPARRAPLATAAGGTAAPNRNGALAMNGKSAGSAAAPSMNAKPAGRAAEPPHGKPARLGTANGAARPADSKPANGTRHPAQAAPPSSPPAGARSAQPGPGAHQQTGTRQAPPVPPKLQAPPRRNGADPLAAFFRGAGIDPRRVGPHDADALLHRLGQVMREMVAGVSEELHVCAQQKNALSLADAGDEGEAAGESANALKSSHGVDDKLLELLLAGAMPLSPVTAVREAFGDVKRHRQALFNALQAGLAAYIARLDPDTLEQKYGGGRYNRLLGAANKLKYWDLYKDVYDVVAHHPPGELPMQFVQDLAAAYEREAAASPGNAEPEPAVRIEAL